MSSINSSFPNWQMEDEIKIASEKCPKSKIDASRSSSTACTTNEVMKGVISASPPGGAQVISEPASAKTEKKDKSIKKDTNDDDSSGIPPLLQRHWDNLANQKGRPLTDSEKAWNIPQEAFPGSMKYWDVEEWGSYYGD